MLQTVAKADHIPGSHPLLAQIPLTVSPFISLPTATTLSYTYKTIPSTLPQSSTGSPSSSADEKAKYVVSSAGHAAHPDDIIKSCRTLQAYVQKVQDDADAELKAWEEAIKARELAEKRRLAPGWLDSDARILEPERKAAGSATNSTTISSANLMDNDTSSAEVLGQGKDEAGVGGEGEALDRAFGALGLK
jgi:hypothetical protein